MAEETSRDRLAAVEAARRAVLDEGRPEALEKRARLGAMTARQRIDALLDPDSFREIGSLIEPHRDNDFNRDIQAPADGIVAGTGKIDGRVVCVAAQDYTVHGGSSGKTGSAKLVRLLGQAQDRGHPVVFLLEGGGHRIQDGMNAGHFAGASPVFQNMARLSGWVPLVAVMMGQGFAGPTNYASLCDFVVMVEGLATMGMAGPALVKAGTGEDIAKEDLGGIERQVKRQGIADLAAPDEASALAAARRFLSYLPDNAGQPLPINAGDNPPDRRDDKLFDLVPAESRKTYDMRKVVAALADRDSVFEIKPAFARNIVTAFIRLNGRPVGVVANQPLRKGGVLDTPACEKASHFIALCDAYGLPLVFLIDVPGFAIGTAAEETGLGRRSGRLFFEIGIATVPRVSIVLRKGYGGGYYAMAGGQALDADATFAWPTAEICAMSIEGAVDVAFKRDYQAADDPTVARQRLIDRIKNETGPIEAARDFGIDEVIDPRDTRLRLIDTFNACPPRKPNKNPPRVRPISPI